MTIICLLFLAMFFTGCSKEEADPNREFLAQLVGDYDFVCHISARDNWGPDFDTTYNSQGAIYLPRTPGYSNQSERIVIRFLALNLNEATYYLKTAEPIVGYSGVLTWPEENYNGGDYGYSFSGFISADTVVFKYYDWNSQGGPSFSSSLSVRGHKRK